MTDAAPDDAQADESADAPAFEPPIVEDSPTTEALERELEGYARYGRDDRAAEVEAVLKARRKRDGKREAKESPRTERSTTARGRKTTEK